MIHGACFCCFPTAQVFLLYGFEREVAPVVKKADWEKRPFGAHMDVARMVALQVLRVAAVSVWSNTTC